jgi:hypothetical protein
MRILNQAPDEAGSLLQVRSNIRDALRDAERGQDFETARLLEDAEHVLTGELRSQLPPHTNILLKAADVAYHHHKVIEDAAGRAGPEGAFSPAQLWAAVKKSVERGRLARGGGGELRDLAHRGIETVAKDSPITGARLLAKLPASIPVIGKLLSEGQQGFSALANVGPIKSALLGETGIQRLGGRLLDALRQKGIQPAVARAIANQSAQTATEATQGVLQ